MADRYVELPRAQLTPDYLHANSTTHEFLFGALAELVDNARDARATHLSIYTEENEQRTGGMVLCFLDDGVGMDPDEAADVIHLGKSSKRTSDYPFSGQYGNGLKSGAMRIGMDFILFTKKTNTMTCILLSRTFYEKEGIDEVIVPVPSWFVSTQEPIKTDDLTFSIEMALIYKYSPFSTEFDVMQQFHKITGSSGTLVIIYNVKLNDDGEPELDVVSDPSDLLLTGMVRNGIQPERYSFRAYAAILYIDPYMKIYIQGKKVCAKPLIFSLYRPRKYTYFSKGFKVRTLREVKEAELAVKVAEEKMQEAKLKMKEFEKTCDDGMEEQLKLAKARTKLSDSQKDVERKKKLYQEKLRALKKPIKLTFIFGVNIENRNCDGMFIYNNCRLIKMYKRIGVQLDCGLRSCDGVVGVVNVPSAMMEPTHNKQDFADAREYHSLLRVMGQCLLQYWKGLDIARAGIVKFWNEFGYVSTNWDWPPSAAVQYRRRRAAEIPVTVQCDLCLRWRVLPSNVDVNDGELPDPWICSMNQNPQQNRCDIAEQLPKIPSGAIKARSPLSNEKQERLEKSIQRHWVKVASLQSQRTFPTEPLAHRLPADSSNKSLSKGITVPKRYPCPLTSRKRHVPASRSPRCTRSHYSAKVTFSGNKRSRTSGCEEVAQIRRDFRPSVLCSEKQPCTSQHSVEDRRITKSLLARKSNYQVFRKEQIGTCNSNMEIPQKELTREITSELIAVPVNVCGKSPISSHSKYLTQAMVKIESTNGDTIGSIHKPFFRWEVKENIVVCSDPERFQGGISLSELCSDVEQVDLTRPMINRGVLKGLVTCFGNLLSHFVPSNYHIPKEKLDNLGAEELVTFPMHDYFMHYERTLRRRLQSTAEGAISRAQELEQKMQQVETQLRETKEKLRFYQNVMDLLLNRNCTPLPEDN